MKSEGFLNLLNQYRVIIPIIQRDYAQGRMDDRVQKIRDNLLNMLMKTMIDDGKPLTLDFIYGYTKCDAHKTVFYPLDGQQRLTTLFLLHWYYAMKSGCLDDARDYLHSFQYETRHSSMVFCQELIKFQMNDLSKSVDKEIENQSWFFRSWRHDPTINGMLRMLAEIQKKDKEFGIQSGWEKLASTPPPITFYCLQMNQLGLADDLYIRMNARGKELTEFEYFKVRFCEELEEEYKNNFYEKMDRQWLDLFWSMFRNDGDKDVALKVDKAFTNFLRYYSDMLAAKGNRELIHGIEDFDGLKQLYKFDDYIKDLENTLDSLAASYSNDNAIFSQYFYILESDFSVDKVKLFSIGPSVDLLKKCARDYNPSLMSNPFPIGEQIILYAVICHLRQPVHGFEQKIRRIRNLISASEDTLRKENIGKILLEVEAILRDEIYQEETRLNRTQRTEEGNKEALILSDPSIIESMYRLEDHRLLQGTLAVFTSANNEFIVGNAFIQRANAFLRVFKVNCNYEEISRSLFAIGDYTQLESPRTLVGSKKEASWRNLFTMSRRRKGFDKTQNILSEFLDRMATDSALTPSKLIDEYHKTYTENEEREKSWSYYYINFKSFRKHQDGCYRWPNPSRQYECLMMNKTHMNGQHWDPFLMAIMDLKKLPVDLYPQHGNYGENIKLYKNDATIELKNIQEGFLLIGFDENGQTLIENALEKGFLHPYGKLDKPIQGLHKIRQTESGVDIEDRLENLDWIKDVI